MEKIKVIVEKTKTGYSAYANNYTVYSTGKDYEDVIKNIVEALNFYFENSAGFIYTVSKDDLIFELQEDFI